MFYHYLKIACRSLIRNRYFTVLNIIGLSMGVAVIILILLWVQDELSYDNFHENRKEISRILMAKDDFEGPSMIYPLAGVIKEGIPEILNITQTRFVDPLLINYNNKSFYENNVLATDSAFLQIFSFPLLHGNINDVLKDPQSVVLTQETSEKYFGDEDPMGKILKFEGKYSFKVTGVLKNVPKNSHLKFNILVPLQPFIDGSYENVGYGTGWGDPNFQGYILLGKNSSDTVVARKITQIALENKAPHVYRLGYTFKIQNLSQIYLYPKSYWDIAKGDMRMVIIFSLIAVFILIIACFNFINLSTALVHKRMRSIGFYKIIGASRSQLIFQLLGESFIIAFLSLNFALIIGRLLMPIFNEITGKQLELNIADPQLIRYMLLILLFTGFAAGIYPSLILSRFKPVVALKGEFSNLKNLKGGRKEILRKTLVVMQFIISIALIIGTIVIYRQFNYAISSSWKSGNDFVIHLPVKENAAREFDQMKSRLLQHPNIVSVAMKDCLPTELNNSTSGVYWDGKGPEHDNVWIETTAVSYDYFKTVNTDVVMGRDFSKEYGTDSIHGFIIDDALMKVTGYHDPIGQNIKLYSYPGKIIGVVKNQLFKSINSPNRPMFFYLIPKGMEAEMASDILIRVTGIEPTHKDSNLNQLVEFLEKEWKAVNKIAPFEYHFLDETIKAQYAKEQNLGRLISYFSVFTIFISCLGLMGLVAAISQSRTKEIAIRKVNGAKTEQIFFLLLKDFMILVFIATVIACPIAWYFMNEWLQSYTLRIQLSPWIFIFSFGILSIISILTLGIQTYHAALRNPVKSLKYE
ncbi:MAG: ABC transporter permease [Bacteroidetes bacterium]|nr:ABC transporter permease [Bacteroidota bacterium]